MGQYGGQPDFITKAVEITPSDTIDSANKLNGAALFIGTAGDVNVIMSGVAGANGGFPIASQAVLFKGVAAGSYLNVIVDYILDTDTSAADVVACY